MHVFYHLENVASRKHAYVILIPSNPTFIIVKLGFTGVYIIFLICAQNIDCGYSLEPPRRGGSKEYPQSMFWAQIWKILVFFLSENFQFLEVKFSIYLNRCVFVMLNILKYLEPHEIFKMAASLTMILEFKCQ